MSSNSDCDNGDKFVIKNTAGVNRRQFLFVEGKTILAFVPKGKKFTECNVFTEVTDSVNCKVCIKYQVKCNEASSTKHSIFDLFPPPTPPHTYPLILLPPPISSSYFPPLVLFGYGGGEVSCNIGE